MKHFYIIGNWKMYSLSSDAHIIATSVRNELEHLESVDVVLCPPAIWLTEVAKIIHNQISHLHVGIQNIFDQEEGAYTGEISAKMAANVAQYAIIGHSERVEHFREGPEFINSKVHAALLAGLTPIVCVGEREKNEKSKDKLIDKLYKLLTGLTPDQLGRIIVAYEPVWAVGASSPDTPENANEVATCFQQSIYKNLKVIYGGSINENNCAEFLKQENLSGLLVGRASIKIKSFVTICRKAEAVAKAE